MAADLTHMEVLGLGSRLGQVIAREVAEVDVNIAAADYHNRLDQATDTQHLESLAVEDNQAVVLMGMAAPNQPEALRRQRPISTQEACVC